MTKQEFIANQRAAKREETRFSAAWIAFFFSILIGNAFVGKWMDHHKPAWPIQVLFGCWLLGLLTANIVFLLWIAKRRARKFGLRCPHCDKPLTLTAGQIAVATGNCSHCGEAVFDSPPVPEANL